MTQQQSLPFRQLERFLQQRMRMSHLYQPLMQKMLIERGGFATLRGPSTRVYSASGRPSPPGMISGSRWDPKFLGTPRARHPMSAIGRTGKHLLDVSLSGHAPNRPFSRNVSDLGVTGSHWLALSSRLNYTYSLPGQYGFPAKSAPRFDTSFVYFAGVAGERARPL